MISRMKLSTDKREMNFHKITPAIESWRMLKIGNILWLARLTERANYEF
jgi:hypothetical protein